MTNTRKQLCSEVIIKKNVLMVQGQHKGSRQQFLKNLFLKFPLKFLDALTLIHIIYSCKKSTLPENFQGATYNHIYRGVMIRTQFPQLLLDVSNNLKRKKSIKIMLFGNWYQTSNNNRIIFISIDRVLIQFAKKNIFKHLREIGIFNLLYNTTTLNGCY